MMRRLCTACLLLALAGCAQVAPWERDILARREIQLDGTPLEVRTCVALMRTFAAPLMMPHLSTIALLSCR